MSLEPLGLALFLLGWPAMQLENLTDRYQKHLGQSVESGWPFGFQYPRAQD